MSTRSILPLFFLALAACGHHTETAKAQPPSNLSLPSSMKLDAPPSAAQSVIDVRKTATDGAEVVVTGRIRDFVGTRAVFTIADMSLKSCLDRTDKMNCETPWDYCCEDPARLKDGSTTIELHDGAALAMGSAQGWNGLDHLKQVFVKGKLTKDDNGNVAVIASGIFVQP